MLELIFQGFLEWAYGLVLECWQFFSTALLDIMSMDFAYLKSHVPIVDDIMQILVAVGWALLLGNLVFQALRSMVSGLGFEGEDPKLLFARTFVFSFLLLASPQICEIGLSMTSRIIDLLQIPDAVNVTLVDESVFGAMNASWLLVIIFGFIIMFKVLKLLLEIAERYLILAMLTITAPLAFAMGGSRSTSEIFSGWCRMFGSMCLLMVTNVVFFKMLLSVLSTVPSGIDVLAWMVLILSIVKVARKADAIITRIGLNPAITGDSLGRGLPGTLTYMVVRTVASQVTKAVGKSTGGIDKGKSPGTSPGSSGGPRMGGPAGSRVGGAGATSYAKQNASQQTTNQQTSTHQGASQQSASQGAVYQSDNVQAGAQQTTTQEYTAGSTYQSGAQVRHASPKGAQDRKTSVPPGTRRSPTHVKAQTITGARAESGKPDAAGRAGAMVSAGAVDAAGAAAVSHIKTGSPVPERAATHGTPAIAQRSPAGKRASGTDITNARGTVAPASQKQMGKSMPGRQVTYRAPSAVQPGSAETPTIPSSSRMTQVSSQKVQGGTVNGTTQSVERTRITVGQTTQDAAPVSTQKSSPSVKAVSSSTPAPTGGQPMQARHADTRFTQRPAQIAPKAATAQQNPSITRQTTIHTENSQHGPAGKPTTAPAQQSVRETRSGRRGIPTGTAVPTKARQHSPARQEPRQTSASAVPTVKGTIPGLHPGSAGTAAVSHQTTQARQTAGGTNSVPAAIGQQAGKRAASTTTATFKGHVKKEEETTPSRKQRGKKK